MQGETSNEGSKVRDLVELGEFYFLNGKLKNALDALIRAKELDPQNVEAVYTLGLVYEAKNSFTDARHMYERVLKLAPNHKAAKNHLEKLVGT